MEIRISLRYNRTLSKKATHLAISYAIFLWQIFKAGLKILFAYEWEMPFFNSKETVIPSSLGGHFNIFQVFHVQPIGKGFQNVLAISLYPF